MKGYRTILLSAALAAFGVLEAADWTSVLDDPQTASFVVIGAGAVAAALRAATTTPLGKKS